MYSSGNIKAAENAINWLVIAQDVGNDYGFSSHYHLKDGWYPSYPEVTGYIIPTLIEYDEITANINSNITKKALSAADWLLEIQLESGAFQGRLIGDKPVVPVVFNTGMVIFGLISAYRLTSSESYLNAANRACKWLIKSQDDDGVWRKNLTLNGSGQTHIYHTRVSWAILELYKITQDKKYYESATKHINWALTHQNKLGWFDLSCLHAENNNNPLIHFLAYTIRGILESGLLLEKFSWIDAAENAAEGFLMAQQRKNRVFARYNSKWEPTVDWACPTGVAQLSIIYLKLYEYSGHKKWLQAADSNLKYLISLQGKNDKNINGAISGSAPIDGPYMKNCYLSWATKFFIDALLLRQQV